LQLFSANPYPVDNAMGFLLLTFVQFFAIIVAMKLNIQKIEGERLRLCFSKAEFSRKLGMSASAYCRMLNGASTKIKTITRIANVLHVDPRDLLLK